MNRLTLYDTKTWTYVFTKEAKSTYSLTDCALAQYIGALEDFSAENQPHTFGQYLASLRKGLNMTQKEFAQKAGIARTTLCKYEADMCRPQVEYLHKLEHIPGLCSADIRIGFRKFICDFDDRRLDLQSPAIIGQLIECERLYFGWTKKDMARALGFTTNTITRIESGRQTCAPALYALIANALQSSKLLEVSKNL